MKEVKGITIDARTSRDLDDAIWLETIENGWRVWVTIADVAHFIKPGSKLDGMARERAFTRYFAEGRNKPMLPRRVSENKSSLLEGRKRKTLTVSFDLDRDCDLFNISIESTSLISSRKLSYEHADEIILGRAEDELLAPMLQEANRLAQLLLESRRRKGALAIYDLNKGWRTNEEGHLVPLTERDAHLANIIVQEFMIAANYAVAEFIIERGGIALFRNHTARPVIAERETILKEIDLAISHPDLMDIATLRRKVNLVLHRATYGPILEGHYGLNLPAYLHFTSPIRRYPDLVNHRIVKALLAGEELPYTVEDLRAIGDRVTRLYQEDRAARDHRFKQKRLRELTRVVRNGYANLDADTFHRAIKLASRESGFEDEGLIAEIKTRFHQDLLQPRDVYFILFGNKSASEELKREALAYLAKRPFWAVSVLGLANQDRRWQEPVYSVSQNRNHTFSASAKLLLGERIYETVPAQATQRKAAQQLAALALVAKLTEAEIPDIDSASMQQTKRVLDFSPGQNPKGKLFEVCTVLGLSVKYAHTSSGPDNAKSFECIATLLNGEETLTVSDKHSGTTKRQAERAASEDILLKLAENTRADSNQAASPESQSHVGLISSPS